MNNLAWFVLGAIVGILQWRVYKSYDIVLHAWARVNAVLSVLKNASKSQGYLTQHLGFYSNGSYLVFLKELHEDRFLIESVFRKKSQSYNKLFIILNTIDGRSFSDVKEAIDELEKEFQPLEAYINRPVLKFFCSVIDSYIKRLKSIAKVN